MNITKDDLHDLAERAYPNEPHICEAGIAIGKSTLQEGQIITIEYARKLAAQLFLVADEYEKLIISIETSYRGVAATRQRSSTKDK